MQIADKDEIREEKGLLSDFFTERCLAKLQ